MKTFFIALCSLFITASFAQTKLIAFKSHSGNISNFSVALENDLFSDEGSNFGTPPNRRVFKLDSVIYISPNKTVLIKKEYLFPWHQNPKDTGELVRVSRDTVYNDPLFSRKHSLDSIRYVLKNGPFLDYDNPISKVIFVGYDNKKNKGTNKDSVNTDKPKANEVSPIVTTGNDTDNNSPFDAAMAKALAGIFLLALLGGWLSTKFYNLRLQKA